MQQFLIKVKSYFKIKLKKSEKLLTEKFFVRIFHDVYLMTYNHTDTRFPPLN